MEEADTSTFPVLTEDVEENVSSEFRAEAVKLHITGYSAGVKEFMQLDPLSSLHSFAERILTGNVDHTALTKTKFILAKKTKQYTKMVTRLESGVPFDFYF